MLCDGCKIAQFSQTAHDGCGSCGALDRVGQHLQNAIDTLIGGVLSH
jgi:hypothetical protein